MSPALDIPERVFQRTVIELAERLGWKVAHFHDSRREVRRADGSRRCIGDRAAAGFPDLVLVRRGRIVFAELKREGGRLTEAQVDWLNALRTTGQVEVHVWFPSDWPMVERVLR